ncbi:alpha/beta fold hydrolase [Pedobacter gandavensis]|uniref:Proline iminopeptidase n=1 Tax=Pedobacter gandavensis TaxID=2679963 RepID=A0ABR6EV59_9SPHI|nr:alpha/beta fold hydrolase [Pedobacter gandavensis]MBB2149124.1 alpha/beta fold hydrolase [Pedobacter gandavensis]
MKNSGMRTFLSLAILFLCFGKAIGQKYIPTIEQGPAMIKYDPKLIVKSGYLVVPEDRKSIASRKIKIPFVFFRKPGSAEKKGVTLFSTGGPGYSTIANIDSIGYDSGLLKYGGFIVFDQRGTKRSSTCLDCPEIDTAIKISYKRNLPQKTLVLEAVKKCREKLLAQGINLSAYNTIESAKDINDLRLALQLDSLNLVGISYSGGLMLTVARNHPEGVRALILNSPLPAYVNYEEHALFNINEALNQVFENCLADSSGNEVYKDLKSRFQQYFTSITGKKFSIAYLEKGTKDSLKINYGKSELLDVIINHLNTSQVKSVPFIMNELIKGKHHDYVREVMDGYFSGDDKLSRGMRYSVYCTEQIAYSNEKLIQEQELIMPWLSGYVFNNVDHEICNCWKVTPEPAAAKLPLYSSIPVLMSAGDIDPWCRPFYNQLIKRYMPNSQLLVFHNRGHLSGFGFQGTDFLQLFMEYPYRKIVSPSNQVKVE